jgi:hypothetical protein
MGGRILGRVGIGDGPAQEAFPGGE